MVRFFTITLLSLGLWSFTIHSVRAIPSLSEMKEKLNNGTYSEKEFESMALKLRQQAIDSTLTPRIETKAPSMGQGFNRYPWKRNIFTTVFWIGERPSANNPVPNNKSTWDSNWARNFGGYDNPKPSARSNFIPKGMIPKQNPFYCALPYNDITRGRTKVEVAKIVPWFKEAFVKPGQSVLKGRWIAIHYNGRTCFAQWEDCGPFRTDHSNYVFGNERPRPNLNHGAGLDVSPAVRDYLGLDRNEYCDWKFVDASAVPDGPWKTYGTNNTFWLLRQGKDLKAYDPNNSRKGIPPSHFVTPSATGTLFKNSPTGARVTPQLANS
ncbi:MAG: hypothetical protein DVB29_06945 [Verrucomicrobia bacterium]|nr:MAG: hypothetical protein DVB29_06945 [Verrucomicrobiota bacterium]